MPLYDIAYAILNDTENLCFVKDFHAFVFYGYFIKEMENIFCVFPCVIETVVKVWV